MATRGTIGYETQDGGYVGVYCHYDSYPSHMGPILHGMFHIDVVLMVNRALATGGIRWVAGVNDYKLFNDGKGAHVHTEWPTRPEEYAYRKRIDGRLEYIDSSNTVFVWGEHPPGALDLDDD
jgi:hypothetical protein